MALFSQNGFKDPVGLYDRERAQFSEAANYMTALRNRYRASIWLGRAARLAAVVEPTDRTHGKDARAPIGAAFFDGSLVGIHTLYECTPSTVLLKANSTYERLGLGKVAIGDMSDDDFAQAKKIVETGERGATYFPGLGEFIEILEADVRRDATLQPHVRRGFGVFLFIINETVEQIDFHKMEDAASLGVNWDNEISKLLGPE